jgi:hypothetical protein
MLDIANTTPVGNGVLRGRGLQRRRLPLTQRIALAADVATGRTQFEHSHAQLAALFGITAPQLRAELRCRDVNAADRAEAEAVNAIVAAWSDASPQAREIAVNIVGVAAVWDAIAAVVR